jgi:predicted nucleotidyltransferase
LESAKNNEYRLDSSYDDELKKLNNEIVEVENNMQKIILKIENDISGSTIEKENLKIYGTIIFLKKRYYL